MSLIIAGQINQGNFQIVWHSLCELVLFLKEEAEIGIQRIQITFHCEVLNPTEQKILLRNYLVRMYFLI